MAAGGRARRARATGTAPGSLASDAPETPRESQPMEAEIEIRIILQALFACLVQR